ncbi:MAG TPA: PIN domain-containing protein [Pararhizobium sp.]|uniref:PIN domain-containing protein n=1 Tax=Pararhizobium sp. TaxID=1977563 RepID=UPI002BBF33FC|nr:PIN domain-containing protein [Pararhizobium sp.]HTO33695.1 PIN domain-containing protein [Pararhizobium sp.]
MIGIDTNVLLRFILADHAGQFEAVKRFLSSRSLDEPAFISLFVFAETSWVLRRRYGYANSVIAATFRQLLTVEEFFFEDEPFLDDLLSEEEKIRVGDISDHVLAYIAARSGCWKTVTFDRDAARTIPGMELLA